MTGIGGFHRDNPLSSTGWVVQDSKWGSLRHLEASRHGFIPSVPWANVFTTVSLFPQL